MPTFQLASDDEGDYASSGDNGQQSQFTFSQILPDQSQCLDAARAAELKKLNELNPTARNQIVTDLSRILLFKGLAGDPIDKTKCIFF